MQTYGFERLLDARNLLGHGSGVLLLGVLGLGQLRRAHLSLVLLQTREQTNSQWDASEIQMAATEKRLWRPIKNKITQKQSI